MWSAIRSSVSIRKTGGCSILWIRNTLDLTPLGAISMQTPVNSETEALLTPEEVSKAMKVPVRTLSNWRSTNRVKGLPFVRVGNSVRYRPSDVRTFIESNLKQAIPPL
jgi:excisionase family DNA binding protein